MYLQHPGSSFSLRFSDRAQSTANRSRLTLLKITEKRVKLILDRSDPAASSNMLGQAAWNHIWWTVHFIRHWRRSTHLGSLEHNTVNTAWKPKCEQENTVETANKPWTSLKWLTLSVYLSQFIQVYPVSTTLLLGSRKILRVRAHPIMELGSEWHAWNGFACLVGQGLFSVWGNDVQCPRVVTLHNWRKLSPARHLKDTANR